MAGQWNELPVEQSVRLRRFCMTVCLWVWLGGLTFYAAVVVPLGARLFGSVEQGLLTQQVTVRLNVLGTLAGVATVFEAILQRRRRMMATACAQVVSQAALWVWHARLSSLLDLTARTIHPDGDFYAKHQVYLWLVAIQWCCGVVAAWQMTPSHAQAPHSSPT